MTQLELFSRLLRARGFSKDGATAQFDYVRVSTWLKLLPDGRRLRAQIWSDGEHRMTHDFDGWETTVPTDFDSERSLDDAIRIETSRQDHKKLSNAEAV